MKEIHKTILGVVMIIIMLAIFQTEVLAVTPTISAPSTVESGDSVTVNVTLKSVASWNITISATGATTGGSKSWADATEDAMNTTKTFSFTCKSSGEGTITIKVTGDVSTESGTNSEINQTKTITVNKKKEETKPVQQPEAPKPSTPETTPTPTPGNKPTTTPSKEPATSENTSTMPSKETTSSSSNSSKENANKSNSTISSEEKQKMEEERKKAEEEMQKAEEEKRKQEELAEKRLESLSVNGYELTPEFNQEVEEYFIELPITEEKITINAKAISNLATLQGIGEFAVNEENNEFEVIVIAGNGEKRSYKINATVIDKEPIALSMNGKEYEIIKRKALMKNPDEKQYTETTIKINSIEVPAYKNNENGEIIVEIKDENNEITYLKLQDEQETKIKIKQEINMFLIISIGLGVLLLVSVGINILLYFKYKNKKLNIK